MSFDNHYPNRKDWRKPYRKSKSFDRSCRNHGRCGWCEGNRMHRHRKQLMKALDESIARYYTGKSGDGKYGDHGYDFCIDHWCR